MPSKATLFVGRPCPNVGPEVTYNIQRGFSIADVQEAATGGALEMTVAPSVD